MSKKIYAVSDHLSEANHQLMTKLIQATTGVKPIIVSVEDSVPNDALIIAFGRKAYEAFYDEATLDKLIPVPGVEKLIDIEANEESRQWAWERLKQIKLNLDEPKQSVQSNSLTREALPPITSNDVVALEKANPNGWIGKTKDGRSIRLSARKNEEGSEDIRMTFAELYALKVAVELLDVTEFTLVPSNQTDTSSGS